MPDGMELLGRLVAAKGITGDEGLTLSAAEEVCGALGLSAEKSQDGLIVRIGDNSGGPALCFGSHLDTVPAGEGWTTPPHGALVRDGVLFGRGAVDARASCVAILLTLAHFASTKADRCNLVGLLSLGEEGLDPSLPRLLHKVKNLRAAVVGEPTNMQIATAQRGLLILELKAAGDQGHAARSHGKNAILALARDLLALHEVEFPKRHPSLGSIRITPTRLKAGVADNATPPSATALLDVRTTPLVGPAEIISELRKTLNSDVRVVSDVWIPCETPESHPLVHCARRALPGARLFGSDAASDWVFFARLGIPAIKLGPGNQAYAHAPDERISAGELELGVAGYIRLVEQWMALNG